MPNTVSVTIAIAASLDVFLLLGAEGKGPEIIDLPYLGHGGFHSFTLSHSTNKFV